MGEYRQYAGLIGWFLLALVVILLGTNTNAFRIGASFIDTELNRRGADTRFVRTTMDLSNAEEVGAFPKEMGNWTGFDYTTSNLEEDLRPDVLFMRGYFKLGLSQPVFLLLMQSGSGESFHAPIVCYPVLGYQIEEEATELVYIADASWAEEGPKRMPAWAEQLELPFFSGTLSVKKLVVFKEAQGKIVERRAVLYFYVKDQAISGKVTMVRVSTLLPLSGSYGGAIKPAKELMGEVVPRLFQPRPPGRMLISILADWSVAGYIIILLLFSVPLGLIIYSRFAARNRD